MDCIFCKIIKKEISSSVVYEDDKVLAFHDISPQAPVHILVIPKKHIASVASLEDMAVISDLFSTIKKIAEEKGIDKTGYRVVVNQGRDAGQVVPHLHFHLLGGRSLGWPPG